MSKDRSRELQDLHNKGESDSSDGKCSPPHSNTSELLRGLPIFGAVAGALGEKTVEEMRADNKAYFEGHNNTNDQKKKS